MTRDEFKILAKAIKAAYPNQNILPDSESMSIWYELLKDLDYMVAQAAVQKHMVSSKFPPTIADIREKSAGLAKGYIPTWSEGWGQVVKAISRYGLYDRKGALESMDDITRTAVERMGFEELCRSENQSVDRANFRMIYEQIVEREQEVRKLPEHLVRLTQNVGNRIAEGENDNERKSICGSL